MCKITSHPLSHIHIYTYRYIIHIPASIHIFNVLILKRKIWKEFINIPLSVNRFETYLWSITLKRIALLLILSKKKCCSLVDQFLMNVPVVLLLCYWHCEFRVSEILEILAKFEMRLSWENDVVCRNKYHLLISLFQ